MSNAIKITGQLAIWLPDFYRPEELMRAVEKGNTANAISMLSFYGPADKQSFNDYVRMGVADVTVHLISKDEMVASQLRALQSQLDAERTKWLTKQQEILERISKLQAITNEVEA